MQLYFKRRHCETKFKRSPFLICNKSLDKTAGKSAVIWQRFHAAVLVKGLG